MKVQPDMFEVPDKGRQDPDFELTKGEDGIEEDFPFFSDVGADECFYDAAE